MNIKGFSTLVQGMAASIQAGAAGLVDFTIGSILRAVAEAVAQVVLWLQGLILTLLATTRAATSSGSDLDSFMADFDLERLKALAGAGSVTFSRFTATAEGFVQVGALIATTDGSQQASITADTSNPSYSASRGGYVIAPGTASVTVAAVASTAGGAGNVAAGAFTIIVDSEMTGIDTVTNSAPFTGGQDAETDPAFRTRFRAYLKSLRTSNRGSIEYAISNVQAGLRSTIVRNQTYPELRTRPGYFFVAVDDGSGSPPQTLLDAVYAAVLNVVALGVQFGVYAPSPLTVNVGLTIAVSDGTDFTTASAAVKTAIATYIASLSMNAQTVPLTRIAQVAYDASDSVANVTGVSLNSVASDLALTAFQIPEVGTITVTQ